MPGGVADFSREGHRLFGGGQARQPVLAEGVEVVDVGARADLAQPLDVIRPLVAVQAQPPGQVRAEDRKSTRLNSSHTVISYAVFCLKKKKKPKERRTI